MPSVSNDQETSAKSPSSEDGSALARGLAILEAITSSPSPMSVKDLAEETGIPRPSVARIATTLAQSGYIRQLEGKERFFSTTKILELGNTFLRHFDIRKALRPRLHELADECGAAIHLCIRNRLDMVVIESVRPSAGALTIRLGLGDRLNIATSAIGRAYLAALPVTERDALVDAIHIASNSERLNIRAVANAAVDELTTRGYVSVFGDWDRDVNAVAIPIQAPSGERFAINCGGPAFLFPPEVLTEQIAPRLLTAVRRLQTESGLVVFGQD